MIALVLASPLPVRTAYAGPSIGGCSVLPADDIWNTPVDTLPVHANSSAYVKTIGPTRGLKADFGSGLWDGGPIGIPYVTVAGTQPKYPATFEYDDESDPGPYAVPLNAPIEGGPNATGDRHAIAIDTTNCTLYELYAAYPGASSWAAGSGAIYDLESSVLRPRPGPRRPACPSSPAWCATTRFSPVRSRTLSGSRCLRPRALTSGPRDTTPPA